MSALSKVICDGIATAVDCHVSTTCADPTLSELSEALAQASAEILTRLAGERVVALPLMHELAIEEDVGRRRSWRRDGSRRLA